MTDDPRARALPPEPDDPEAQSVAETQPVPPPRQGASSGAVASAMVAAGIFLSRVAGLVRERVFAQYFGTSVYADVFKAGLRMPNVLQNLLGEGTLSASFIPVYAELVHQGRKEEAGKVAGAIFSLLFAIAGALVLIGVAAAPLLVSVFLPGFEGERRALTIDVVRILLPMTGVLVLSAWSLGILNSHRYFFLSYFAPVLWNAAMIATLLLLGGGMHPRRLVVALAWGALAGGFLQLLVQLPGVLKLERQLKINWGMKLEGVRETMKNAGPAVMGRGVVQISGWLDNILASFLAIGAVATLQYAQTLYLLPISLFGMSVAAAELPELARQRMGEADVLRRRASGGLERIAFYVVPSFVGFLALGDVVVGGLYQTGEFDRGDTLVVYAVLAAFSLGLLATTASRMLSSTFFALRDTRTPARYAMLRVAISMVLATVLMLQFESITVGGTTIPAGVFGDVRIGGQPLGPVGLALGGVTGAWLEWALLKRALRRRIGPVGGRPAMLARMFGAALAAAALGWGVRLLVEGTGPFVQAVLVLGVYGVAYFGIGAALGLEQSGAIFRRFRNLAGRG
ncbi:MAG TPA: murein biosynthesis integral membrane protein MurJ [Longimicrobiaceae bacterium]|nr:murein biosynthesis integral membrane protein MurJ [Longimicrobiaceae bacterium]